jgi:hypothetical protein
VGNVVHMSPSKPPLPQEGRLLSAKARIYV